MVLLLVCIVICVPQAETGSYDLAAGLYCCFVGQAGLEEV
jgi:hypothetical protein